MIKKSPVVVVLLNMLLAQQATAKGCSDAGFCTIGHLKQLQAEDEANRHQKISILLPVGTGDESVFVFTSGLQYGTQFSKLWAIQAKLTANTASGNLGNAAGPGDLYLSGTYSFPSKTKWIVSATLGIKVALNKGDLKEGSKSLPMQYQSSLGIIDIISGSSFTNNKWQFAAGWQQPILDKNSNQFLPAYWNTAESAKYAASKDFNRKAGVLLRSAYLYKVNKKFSVNGGLPGIYHLEKAAWYQVNNKLQLGYTAGSPLVVRDVHPDGLTRKFIFSPQIS
jgi:hypothetical protein